MAGSLIPLALLDEGPAQALMGRGKVRLNAKSVREVTDRPFKISFGERDAAEIVGLGKIRASLQELFEVTGGLVQMAIPRQCNSQVEVDIAHGRPPHRGLEEPAASEAFSASGLFPVSDLLNAASTSPSFRVICG